MTRGFEGGKSIHTTGRTFFLKVPAEGRPHTAIEELLSSQGVKAAVIQGIGGFRWARLAVFSPIENKYYPKDFEAKAGKVIEAASLTGNSILGPDGRYYTHLHAVIAVDADSVAAGHLVDAIVDPFLELVIIELVDGYEALAGLLSHRWMGLGSQGSPSSSGSSP